MRKPWIVILDDGADMLIQEFFLKRIIEACTPLTFQILALYCLCDSLPPNLYAPIAVGACIEPRLVKLYDNPGLVVDTKGYMSAGKGGEGPGQQLARPNGAKEFFKWYADRVAAGDKVLPKKSGNVVKPVEGGGFPNRVHVFEDFETDIEKRWWMSGKAMGSSIRPWSRPFDCRGTLTQDFDDKQGDLKTMYAAVIFNPVPGPPMGKNPRLSFRYRLDGTDTLRVQIYSLTNGYHRYLSLTGLPEREWQSATVNMTQARRPDGSGGPLSENERIDDIQFYVDPRADLLIDDIVLYDAGKPDEKRPFPRQVLFTGWFDTGKQGQEWPGRFEIVPKKGYFWHAARSVADADSGDSLIRVNLRGERPIRDIPRLFFRYQLTGADSLRVVLADGKNAGWPVELKKLEQGRWAEADVEFADVNRPGDRATDIEFRLPKGAELLIDDLLLYVPGG